jgi:hypothetical protein
MNSPTYLSRGIDYLGDLGAKLRDLQGYRTLSHELIQNADDAANATLMSFDVADEAFIVDNDGVFSDCGHVDASECPWKADGAHNHRCDFHRFRYVAAGDKRGEANTTGAFGIGFIAVYQITDAPQLISGGRHWILHEDRPEQQRIEICPGCAACRLSGLPGTRFILPWARDGDSVLRRALRAEPVDLGGPKRMSRELLASLPVAMLFLRRLRRVVIKEGGAFKADLQRLDETDSLIVSDGKAENDQVWHLVHGEFPEAATALRQKHRGRIEDKRSSRVTLAIPAVMERAGLLCAGLPTEHDTGLPFHVNADFFPTNDRKRVILAQDYQSEWNRAALEAAGRAAGKAVDRLPTLLGAKRFWEMVSRLKDVADRSGHERGEPALGEFWKHVSSRLRSAPVIRTSRSQWVTADDACLLLQKEESFVLPILESLGVQVVHEDLRPYQTILRSEAVGIPVLDIERICSALKAAGLDNRIATSALPSALETIQQRDLLYAEIASLLERQQRTPKARVDDERRLKEIALAPGRDGALWPCREIFSADEDTVALFEMLGLETPFLNPHEAFLPLAGLCRRLSAAAGIEALGRADMSKLTNLLQHKGRPIQRLFAWLENRREEILADSGLKSKLGALTLFPSNGALRPLGRLALPGDFNDPLGLAELVDLSVLGGRSEFLRDLGMPELDFPTYAAAHLPGALADPAVTPDKRRAAVMLLANRVGELKDNVEARQALSVLALVECTDGQFHQPQQCYFDSQEVRDSLGVGINVAVLAAGHEAAVRDLLEWLGVAYEPRLGHVVEKVVALSSLPYSADAAQHIKLILGHLAKRVTVDDGFEELAQLKSRNWIPARAKRDRWYAPKELYATYQDYLFESQALFVDLPAGIQNAARALLGFLGVSITPPVSLVVKHLVHCAGKQTPVNNEVYRFLNQNSADLSLRQLLDKKCLLLGDTYRAPTQAFWSEHPFGRFRWRLGEELRAYGNLLSVLGVREKPGSQDALAVLREISTDFGSENRALDEDAHAVLMSCWRLIDKSLAEGDDLSSQVEGLRTEKCVPKLIKVLNPPEWMFFENRAGLAAKFGDFLAGNVIQKPLDAGNALAKAGVRSLGAAVEVELLECGDPVEAPEMTERIRARRNEIGRVLEAQAVGQATAEVLDRLAGIRCTWAAFIEIRYRLSAFNRELHSESEQVPALYQRDQDALLIARRGAQPSWAPIARELAIALFPDEDPGRLAAGLKEALAPESTAEAEAVLDELGFPRIDTEVPIPVDPGATAGTLGTDAAVANGHPTQGEQLTPEEALERLLGGNARPLTPPAPDPGADPPTHGRGPVGGKASGASKKKGRPVLRSYVQSPDADVDGDSEGEVHGNADRSPVDEAGVARVLAHEVASGRVPEEMPHKNPGYDIESRDVDGKVVRYIEVKSFSGDWKSTYAVLSQPQFNKASELGDLFWLYVVERAESENFFVHRIQNPATRANHFMFDDGWHALAEFAVHEEKGK